MKKFKSCRRRIMALVLAVAVLFTSGCGSEVAGLYADEMSTEFTDEPAEGTEEGESESSVNASESTDLTEAVEEDTGMPESTEPVNDGTESILPDTDAGTEFIEPAEGTEETESASSEGTEVTEPTETTESETEIPVDDTESTESSESVSDTEVTEKEPEKTDGLLYVGISGEGKVWFESSKGNIEINKTGDSLFVTDCNTGTVVDMSDSVKDGYYLIDRYSDCDRVAMGVRSNIAYTIEDVSIKYKSGQFTGDESGWQDLVVWGLSTCYTTFIQIEEESKYIDISFLDNVTFYEPGTPHEKESGEIVDSGEIPNMPLIMDAYETDNGSSSISEFSLSDDGIEVDEANLLADEALPNTLGISKIGSIHGDTYLYVVTTADGANHTAFCVDADSASPAGRTYPYTQIAGGLPYEVLGAMLTAPIPNQGSYDPIGKYPEESMWSIWGTDPVRVLHYLLCIWGGAVGHYDLGVPDVATKTEVFKTQINEWLIANDVLISQGVYQLWRTNIPVPDGYQTLMWATCTDPVIGYAVIKKSPMSYYNDIVNGNSLYTNYSATFNITDGGSYNATITTDSNGNYGPIKVAPGTYTVTEVKPPAGYELPEIASQTITIGVNETKEFAFEDKPIGDPAGLVLYKKDNQTGKESTSPQGDVDFTEAEFTVKYYDNLEGKDEGDPKKTFAYWPDEEGVVWFNRDIYLADDSDDFWRDPLGMPLFLAGTYVVTETVSPSGYKPNEGKYIAVLDYDNKWTWKSYPTTDDNKLIIEKKPDGTVTGGRIVNETKTTGLSFRKFAKATGGKPIKGTSFEGVQFYLYNMSESPIRYEYKDAAGEDKAKWVATAGHKLAVVIIQISQGCIS